MVYFSILIAVPFEKTRHPAEFELETQRTLVLGGGVPGEFRSDSFVANGPSKVVGKLV